MAGSRTVDLLVAGHINIDRLVMIDRPVAPDRTVVARRSEARLGGTAANLALAASHWGVRCALASRIGPDLPADLWRLLTGARIDLSAVVRDPGARTPSCTILESPGGGTSTVIDQGAMAGPRGPTAPRRLLRATSWVHLTTGAPPALLALQAEARAAGRPVSVDPSQEVHYRWSERPLRRLLEGAEILFGNREEIARTTRILRLDGPADLLALVPMVVRTDGPNGAEAFTRNGRVRVPAPRPIRAARTTGAGEAFRGGFYAGWFAGQPLAACLEAGHRSSRWWIAAHGPGRGGRSDR